ncbi:unnamed protein product, partial [marine sediment metagenome]
IIKKKGKLAYNLVRFRIKITEMTQITPNRRYIS